MTFFLIKNIMSIIKLKLFFCLFDSIKLQKLLQQIKYR